MLCIYMAFIWQAWNLAHLARHHVTPELAEAIFAADDFFSVQTDSIRSLGRGTHQGRTYRVVFIKELHGDVYVITCHREHPDRRFP